MTHSHFDSPALFRPEWPHSVALARLLLAAAAILITVVSWTALGTQAGRPGDGDERPQVELPAVVISGHRELGDGTPALVAARSGVECATPSASRMSGAGNGVTLAQ